MRTALCISLIAACADRTEADPKVPAWRCKPPSTLASKGAPAAAPATLSALLDRKPTTLGAALGHMRVGGPASRTLTDAIEQGTELWTPIPNAPHARLAQIGRDVAGNMTNVSLFVDGHARCAIANVWGPPTIARSIDAIWLDAKTQTRAIVTDSGREAHLVVSAFTSIDDVLDSKDPKRLGFEAITLLDATASDVRRAFPGVSGDERLLAFGLPPLPQSLPLSDTIVALDLDAHDRVQTVRVQFDTGEDRAVADAITAAVERKYGAPTAGSYAGGKVTIQRDTDFVVEVVIRR